MFMFSPGFSALTISPQTSGLSFGTDQPEAIGVCVVPHYGQRRFGVALNVSLDLSLQVVELKQSHIYDLHQRNLNI
jgi:hypothetical protein